MSNLPADIINEALDAAGVDFTIGEATEGTKAAQVALRHYGQSLRQLLRMVHWDFARKVTNLTMLADATGQTDGVGTTVISPWCYEYAYPTDCMKARFLPVFWQNPNTVPTGNIVPANSSVPTSSVTSQPPYATSGALPPAPFLISMDTNYPIDTGGNWLEVQGESPTGRVVILTNVNLAQLVYTAFMPYPSMWDSQFRAAMVAFLAAQIAMPLSTDKKFGLVMRDRNITIAKNKVMDARVTNGNESGFPQTTDHIPDWMRTRTAGGGRSAPWVGGGGPWGIGGYGWNGAGFMGYGWDSSVF